MVPEDDNNEPVVDDGNNTDPEIPGGGNTEPETPGGENIEPSGDPGYDSPMEEDWELWEKLLSLDSESAFDARQYAIEQSIEAFLSGMEEDPAYQSDSVVEGETTPLILSRTSSQECSIKAPPDTNIHIGDMVECFDENWIVVELYADKIGIINGKMWICNDIIHFQNHSPTVYTRYVVVDDGSYSRRSTDPYAYVPTNTYKIYISLESASQYLYIDKRLALGTIYDQNLKSVLEVYKINGIDIKSGNHSEGDHLMILTVQRDVYHEANDSIEYDICDIYSPMGSDTPVPQPTGSCLIVGRDTIRIGSTGKYKGTCVNEAGEAVSGTLKIWAVVKDSQSIEYGCTDSDATSTLTLTVPFDESLIGEEITMTLSEQSREYGSYEKKVRVIGVG